MSEKLGGKDKGWRKWVWEAARKWAGLCQCQPRCDQHRLSQLCQQWDVLGNSDFRTSTQGNSCLVSGWVPFCPCSALLAPQICILVFLPVFSFFKSVFFTSHFKDKDIGISWQTGIAESPFFIKIWDSVICYLNSIYCLARFLPRSY